MKILFLILFFLFQALFAEDFHTLIQKEGGIVLEMNGYGKSIEEAKSNALQELVFMLQTSVKTTFELKTKVHNGGINSSEDANNQLSMNSSSFFRGLHYSDPLNTQNGYEVQVVLTQEGLEKTQDALQEDIFRDLHPLSRIQKEQSLEKVAILRSLFPYIHPSKNLQQRLITKEKEINKYLNMARVTFVTNAQNAKIEIGGKYYKNGEEFFLEKGRYHYTILADGYHDEDGVIYLQAGISKTFYKNFIKLQDTSIQVYIQNNSDFNIDAQIRAILSKYSIQTTKEAYAINALYYSFTKEFLDTFGTTKFYRFSLKVDAYKGTKIFMSKKATIKRVASSRLVQKSAKLTKALTKALLQKLNIAEFRGDKKVYYK